MNVEIINILLVEDNPGDVRLTQEALVEAKVRNALHVAANGRDAMKFLRRQEPFLDAWRPHMILLDLNLPGMDGREILAEIKGDSELKRIPVVVLTSSAAEEDIMRSYDLQANCYITKPVRLDSFLDVVRQIESFWLAIVTLPPS